MTDPGAHDAGVVVIGGASVAPGPGGAWLVQSRILRYLEGLAAELGPVTFFATVQDNPAVGADFANVLDPATVRVEPLWFAQCSTVIGKARESRRVGRAVVRAVAATPRVVHFFPAAGGLSGVRALARHATAYLAYYKSDWVEMSASRPLGWIRARYWAMAERYEAHHADAMVFRDVKHLARLQSSARGIVEPAAPILAVTADAATRRERAPTRDGPVRVLFVGGLYRRKGLSTLMDALGELHRRSGVPSFELTLVGSQGETDTGNQQDVVPAWLRADIARAGLVDRVAATGFIDDQARLSEQFEQADVFVMPSRFEGFPRAIDEAMSYGLPVIATNVGGIPDVLVAGQDALLVPADDTSALRDALAELLCSESRRRELGDRALASYRRRIVETASEQHVRLLRSVLARMH